MVCRSPWDHPTWTRPRRRSCSRSSRRWARRSGPWLPDKHMPGPGVGPEAADSDLSLLRRKIPPLIQSARACGASMAQPDSAMSPQQALSTIANLRTYRETLTRRAAGIVWMVWGLALSFHAFAVVFVEFPGLGNDVAEGGAGLVANSWALESAALVVMLAVGGALTNA